MEPEKAGYLRKNPRLLLRGGGFGSPEDAAPVGQDYGEGEGVEGEVGEEAEPQAEARQGAAAEMVEEPEGRGDEDELQPQRGPGGAEDSAEEGVHLKAPRNDPEAHGGVDEV